MKHLFIIFVCISSLINAQNKKEYKHSLQGIKKVSIQTNVLIKIIAAKTNQLIISNKNSYKENKELSKKTKGLTAIYSGGRDATGGFGFSIIKEGSTLNIVDLKSNLQNNETIIQLPKTMNIKINGKFYGNIEIEGFSSEVEATTNIGAIFMKNITGPITVYSNTGSINIDFTTVNQSSPISITANTGEIDVTLPQNTNANLSLNTQATIYTNFKFKTPTKKGLKNVGNKNKVVDILNKGGVKIKIQSLMGNIYLRKK